MKTRLTCAAITLALCGCANPKQGTPPPVAEPAPAPSPAPASNPVEAPEPARQVIADDGRPDWWFPEVRREEGMLEFCVETIADESLRGAGRRAVSVAEARGRIEVERLGYEFSADAMRVVNTWGWPLPELPGRARQYAGYALVTIDMAALEPAG